ncbi:TetR/AcrR family transcriptional regulator [Lacrimispora sphenoides]|uniref:DNA-binding transcriptional regulator, AcrR family n=1 Tax=Lacrimispora sphenoides JCM 1415 TaxID=1297793 RepID=A0ABY1C4E6_9FIRM|nr:TetR/AcrR family transcriptional regulator [Lacrimispora sphenoides]SET63796.1 DNA-binding transcriptional regulator, AcrR family [[Clostridium] sphenoides JCM 1415]SUY50197.1 TetR family transcriptional regulator [Lacrimispora sphenoides]
MKKEEKTERTKQKILAAAMEEFGTNGYAGASLNNICSVGIPKGLLYHNFKNKDSIYLACVGQCFSTLTEYLRAADIGSDLQKYMDARLRFFHEHEKETRLFFETIFQPPEALCDQLTDLRQEFDQLNAELYQKILDSLKLRQGVTREEAMSYFVIMQNMFNGYFSSPACRNMSFSDRMTAHETNLTILLDFMLYGIVERGNEK